MRARSAPTASASSASAAGSAGRPEALGEQRELVVGLGGLVAQPAARAPRRRSRARRARAAGAGSRPPRRRRRAAARRGPRRRRDRPASSASSASTRDADRLRGGRRARRRGARRRARARGRRRAGGAGPRSGARGRRARARRARRRAARRRARPRAARGAPPTRPRSGASRRLAMSHAARRASSSAPASARAAVAARAVGLLARRVGGARRRCSAASHAACAPRARPRTAASLAAMSSSRRLRSASTRSSPPSGAWRSSRWRPCQTRPSRVVAMPSKPGGRLSMSSTTQAFHSSRRATASSCSSPSTNVARWRAPGAGGRVARRRAGREIAGDRARDRRRRRRRRAATRPRARPRRAPRAAARRARRRPRARSRGAPRARRRASGRRGRARALPARVRRNWLQAASSAPTRAASRRAASSARSASRRSPRARLGGGLGARRAARAALLGDRALLRRRAARPRRACCSSATSSRSSSASWSAASRSSSASSAAIRSRPAASSARALRRVLRRRPRAASSSAARRSMRSRRSSASRRGCARGAARCARRPSAPRRRGARTPRAARCEPRAPRRPAGGAPRPRRAAASACSRAARAAAAAASASTRSARRARATSRTSSQRASVGLALEALVQLGGLGLALERAQARARLALDVERAVEVVLRALELELRAAAALAVLAEPGGLLDQQPPLARLGRDDRLDAALRDDGVHLLAEAGVAEDLEHVDEPAARAVEAVLALARAVEPAQDRDLAQRHVDRAVGVVDDDLDLGRRARLHAAAAAEDDVAHRLAADGQRRLLAHRPQHGVGDVRLARAVGPDDDRDAGAEVELRAVGEGLEALERQRLQVHRLRLHSSSSSTGSGASGCSVSSAIRAASCSACFFERPAPRPTGAPPTVATTSNVRSCGGPASVATSYSTVSARRARRSCSVDLKSTGCSQRVVDLRLEGLDDRGRGALVAGVQVARADHGLDDRRQHALGLDERLDALPDARRRRRAQQVGHAEALGDRAARDARDALRADLRQPPGAEALGLQARVEVRGQREPEHGVAEERQARVGVRAPLGPRGMREDLPVQVSRQLFEEFGEQLQGSVGSWSPAGREDEVDRLADRHDLRGLLVGHLHAVGVLELLHERVEVERVGLEVGAKARRLVDPRGIDLELVDEVGLDQREDLFAGHEADTVEPLSDSAGPSLRSAPARSSASCVRPTTSPVTPRAASRIALSKPRLVKRPWPTTPILRRPSR